LPAKSQGKSAEKPGKEKKLSVPIQEASPIEVPCGAKETIRKQVGRNQTIGIRNVKAISIG
jgi:hypothetical protein